MKNYSRQREEIIKVVEDSCNHPTAEEIYMKVKEQDHTVSRSTVYRNLGQLVDNGIINRITMCNDSDRYDNFKTIHHHVVCSKCGKVFDFDYNFEFLKVKQEIMKQTGVEVKDKGVTLRGICSECRESLVQQKEN